MSNYLRNNDVWYVQQLCRSVFFAEQRMWLKGLRRFLFVAKDFGGGVEILLAAIVATRAKASVNRRSRGDGISYTEWNSVSVKQVLPKMVEAILTKHHPAIL